MYYEVELNINVYNSMFQKYWSPQCYGLYTEVVDSREDFYCIWTTTLCYWTLKDKYPNFEVGFKGILVVFPYLLLCSYINENAM